MPTLKRYANAAGFTDGLVGWWPMSEGTGTSVADRVGTNTGTLGGTTPPSWADGRFGKCLDFDGTSSKVTCGNSDTVKLGGAWSLSAWINPDSVTGSHVIASTWVYITSAGWQLNTVGNYLSVGFINSAGSTYKSARTADGSIAVGGKYFVVATGNGNNDISGVALYLNGVEATYSRPDNGACGEMASNPLLIGMRNASGSYFYWDGKIDDLRLWNVCLSAAQIKSMFFSKRAQYQ